VVIAIPFWYWRVIEVFKSGLAERVFRGVEPAQEGESGIDRLRAQIVDDLMGDRGDRGRVARLMISSAVCIVSVTSIVGY